MRSMTGFGSGSAPFGSGQVRVEIRALNHRYQDVRVRTSNELSELGFYIEQLARQKLSRGRYDVSVRVESSAPAANWLCEERIKTAYSELRRIRDEVAPGTDLPLAAVLALPGIFDAQQAEEGAASAAVSQAFEEALSSLTQMRLQEGEALATEIRGRIDRLQRLKMDLSEGALELLEHQRSRLRQRVERLLADTAVAVTPERLEQEIAILADKSDITEELVRLDSHFGQLGELTEASDPVGRRFDFLLQEVGREVNTIGSKSQHAEVVHLVVEMKSEVERLREQVQNID